MGEYWTLTWCGNTQEKYQVHKIYFFLKINNLSGPPPIHHILASRRTWQLPDMPLVHSINPRACHTARPSFGGFHQKFYPPLHWSRLSCELKLFHKVEITIKFTLHTPISSPLPPAPPTHQPSTAAPWERPPASQCSIIRIFSNISSSNSYSLQTQTDTSSTTNKCQQCMK